MVKKRAKPVTILPVRWFLKPLTARIIEYDNATIMPTNTATGIIMTIIQAAKDDEGDHIIQAMKDITGTWPNKIQPVTSIGFLFFFLPILTKIMPATTKWTSITVKIKNIIESIDKYYKATKI